MPKVLQAWYASGDRYSVAAALILDPSLEVTLICDSTDGPSVEEATRISQFYLASGVDQRRVVFADVSSEENAWCHGDVERYYRTLVKQQAALHVGYANSIIELHFKRDMRAAVAAIRKAWIGPSSGAQDLALAEFMCKATDRNRFLMPEVKTPLILLWVRFSGKKPSLHPAHPELDTSITALAQIASELKKRGVSYAFIGDKLYSRNKGEDKHDERFAKPPFDEGLDLIEFWRDPLFADANDGIRRLNQLRFIDFLARKFKVISVGMRSGVLEGPAYLGIPTIFIEDAGNPQAERWQKMVRSIPHFQRMEIGRLLTATGVRFRKAEAISKRVGADAKLTRYNRFTMDLARPEILADFEVDFAERAQTFDGPPFELFSVMYLAWLQDVLRQRNVFAADGTPLVRAPPQAPPSAQALSSPPATAAAGSLSLPPPSSLPGPSASLALSASAAAAPKPLSLLSSPPAAPKPLSLLNSAPTTAVLPAPSSVASPAAASSSSSSGGPAPLPAPAVRIQPDFSTTIDLWAETRGLGRVLELLLGEWFLLLVDGPTKQGVRGFPLGELMQLCQLIGETLERFDAGGHVVE